MTAFAVSVAEEGATYLRTRYGLRLRRPTMDFACISCGAVLALPEVPLTVSDVRTFLDRHAPCSCHAKQIRRTALIARLKARRPVHSLRRGVVR